MGVVTSSSILTLGKAEEAPQEKLPCNKRPTWEFHRSSKARMQSFLVLQKLPPDFSAGDV
jgi:hypothetical protein